MCYIIFRTNESNVNCMTLDLGLDERIKTIYFIHLFVQNLKIKKLTMD